MVAQSADSVHQPLMVSTRAENTPTSKNGGKGAKADKKSNGSATTSRRSSARIQALRKAEEVVVASKESEKEGVTREKTELDENNNKCDQVSAKGKKKHGRRRSDGEGEDVNASPPRKKNKPTLSCPNCELNWKEESENVVEVGGSCEKSDVAKIKETMRLFNKHYLHFVQEEEKRCGNAVSRKDSKKVSKSKKVAASPQDSKKGSKKKKEGVTPPREDSKRGASKRPDLKAITKMRENDEILYPEKRIGNIPGIEVGYQFCSRAEMVVLGFHSHWLNGIDFVGMSYSKVYRNYELPVAVAIVLSGMYEDDLDNAEDVIYTGQGGHNLTGNKRQIKDQILERGNLALKNCARQDVPVRVIRGHKSKSSYTGKVYTYDGLYKVVESWTEKGISGFTVFKFRLRRLEGQSALTTNQVYFTNGRVPRSLAEIRGLVCDDISGGQEDMPIPATNLVDDPPFPPTGFTYCKSLKVAKNVKFPPIVGGCKCKGDECRDPTTCACALLNGSDFPYVSANGGRLVEAKHVVFECGPKCGCGPKCVNRTSQKAMRYRLEVFRTVKKGWAVRSWDFIPSGAPVCEYTGILARTEDMDSASENNYIFEIDCLQTIKGLGGRETRTQDGEIPANLLDKYDDQSSESAPEFCIDAGSTGNIARFINHCCEPNLFVQCVLSSHHDLRLARVMLFAADNIPPLQELTYDYGYALDSVLDSNGNIKQMACYCGAPECRKRLF
ncbi:hypothetical protein Fmac_002262 [Flemingia macrophylla]|uniref:Histone-lysine N-methyltransferase, H3 lysine-9 specific SUVH4 n=1 Tax=Flemingia macrophylla TaxID=520843 RepID=A0ABD1NJF6_9FABA